MSRKYNRLMLMILLISSMVLQGCNLIKSYSDKRDSFDPTMGKIAVIKDVKPIVKKNLFGFSKLDAKRKRIYNRIDYALRNMESIVDGLDCQIEVFDDIFNLYYMDNPDLFFLTPNAKYTIYYESRDTNNTENPSEASPYDIMDSLMFDKNFYTGTKSDNDLKQAKINLATKKILSGINAKDSDYKKVKYIHDYLVENVTYVEDGKYDYDIYGALINKKAVCEGYSSAFQYLCYEAGIQCIKVNGKADGGSHSWNRVKINDKFYNVDTTWDDVIFEKDQYFSYEYFCMPDVNFDLTHTPFKKEYKNILPKCTSDSLSYYRKNKQIYDSFDENTMKGIAKGLSKEKKNKKNIFSVYFTNYAAFNNGLIELSKIKLWNYINNLGIDPSHVIYDYDIKARVISFYFN